jgi:hypothetical protein
MMRFAIGSSRRFVPDIPMLYRVRFKVQCQEYHRNESSESLALSRDLVARRQVSPRLRTQG